MKKTTSILLIAVCLLLSACGSEIDAEKARLTAEFLTLDNGLEALKTLFWGAHGWHLYSSGDYLFAAYGDYLVRYDITENRVDSVVKYAQPEYWWCSTSISPDGETVIAKAGNHPDYDDWTNQVFIDFKQETCKSVPDDFELPETANPHLLYRLEKEFNGENLFFKLYASDEDIVGKEIRSVPQYTVSISECVPIDGSRLGIIMGSSEEANGYLGYDKFAVIDIARDEIIQECMINEWDDVGREYLEEHYS
ncbi:MAG: hypothetical protein FWF05_02775 [Oscillospiraceae bacterium]|nr:hypothetical protein [Oscillospiraceae bacterium]